MQKIAGQYFLYHMHPLHNIGLKSFHIIDRAIEFFGEYNANIYGIITGYVSVFRIGVNHWSLYLAP